MPPARQSSTGQLLGCPLLYWNINMSNRREFVVQMGVGASALVAGAAFAEVPMVAETDATATSLGYKADATKVDKTKFPKYAAGQQCGSCALFQGKAGDKAGGCPLFAGKQVATAGWCSAYAKKG
jgi:hypothetical protein